MNEIVQTQLLNNIKEPLTTSCQNMIRVVNSTIVQTYWQIGKLIVEDEQNGNTRAEYGKQVLANLSKELQRERALLNEMDNQDE